MQSQSEIGQGSVCDYDMIILGTCINLSCVYDMCSFIQIKPQSKRHCLSVVIGYVWFGDCRENAVEFKCTFVCLCPWGAANLALPVMCVKANEEMF